jgi:PAS domain S-box-containing protein
MSSRSGTALCTLKNIDAPELRPAVVNIEGFYPLIFIVQMAAAGGIILLIWYSQRYSDRPVTLWFQGLMVAALGWCLAYGMELGFGGQQWKTAMLELRYLFVPYIGVLAFGLSLQMCGKGTWMSRKRLALLLIIPILSTALAMMIPYTGIFKTVVGIDASGPFPVLITTNGPAFTLMNMFNIALLVISCVLLARQAVASHRVFRNQLALLILTLLIPLTVDLAFQAGITPEKGYNATSTSFVFTNLILVWSIYRYGMLNLKPFARGQVIENMSDMMIVEDSAGRIVDVNKAVVEFMGPSVASPMGRALSDVLPMLRLPAQGDGDHKYVTIEKPGTGRIYYFHHDAIGLRDWEERGALHLLHDITPIMDAEKRLRESERMSRELMESAPFPIVVVDIGSGRAAYVNRRAEQLFKVSNERLAGYSVVDFYANPDDRNRVYEVIRESGAIVDLEMMMRSSDGASFWALVSARQVELEGRPCLFAAIRDISDRRRAEQALGRVNDKLKLMSSLTRHDLANNLTGIMGYISMANREVDAKKREAHLARAASLCARTQDVLKFTRDYEEIGVSSPTWQSVADAVAKAGAQLDLGSIELAVNTDDMMVYADSMLVKVFYNLMENSKRHGVRVSRIEVSAEESTGGATIVYQDDGVGIDEGNKELIFERGFGSNTGLGLFFVRQALLITGMTISESGVPGKGARFEIRVPHEAYRQR